MMTISDKRLKKLSRKGTRHSYLREVTVGWIVYQIKALREQRHWSQADLGEKAGKPQSAIARIEAADYGKWSINTLLELAQAFDVALEVRFTDWPSFIENTANTNPVAMMVPSFNAAAFSVAPSRDGSSTTSGVVVSFNANARRPKKVFDGDRMVLETRTSDQAQSIQDEPSTTTSFAHQVSLRAPNNG